MDQEQITISVLDQEYKIKCSPSEVDLLQKSAAFLDIKMSEIKKSAPAMTKDKIAVIGLGYVGLPLARLFATKYSVVGFDTVSYTHLTLPTKRIV